MVKYSVSLLLPLLISSVSARTSIDRYSEDNAPLPPTNSISGSSGSGNGGSPFKSGMDFPDMSCIMSMATDFESCSAAVDANGVGCVWCSLGKSDLGGCFGSNMADMVDSAEFPHFQCHRRNAIFWTIVKWMLLIAGVGTGIVRDQQYNNSKHRFSGEVRLDGRGSSLFQPQTTAEEARNARLARFDDSIKAD